jgi:hypothetical protein
MILPIVSVLALAFTPIVLGGLRACGEAQYDPSQVSYVTDARTAVLVVL